MGLAALTQPGSWSLLNQRQNQKLIRYKAKRVVINQMTTHFVYVSSYLYYFQLSTADYSQSPKGRSANVGLRLRIVKQSPAAANRPLGLG